MYKEYKYNYFANFATHQGNMWANDAYEVERYIISTIKNATGINIWAA